MSFKSEHSSKYAKAIIASYEDPTIKIKEFIAISETIKKNIGFFKDPTVSLDLKSSVIKSDLSPIFKMIILENRLDILDQISQDMDLMMKRKSGTKYLYIESANDDISSLTKVLQKKFGKIEISHSINRDLIAGFVIRFDDYIIDFSLANDLKIISRGDNGG